MTSSSVCGRRKQNDLMLEAEERVDELKGLLLKSFENSLKFEDLSAFLLDDRNFVLSALKSKRGGFDWFSLPKKWKYDEELVCFLLEKNKETNGMFIDVGEKYFSFHDLPYHLQVNRKVIFHALRACSDTGGLMWKDMHVKFQSDTDLLVTALQHNKINFRDIPEELRTSHRDIAFFGIKSNEIEADECTGLSREFYQEVIESGELQWEQLPVTLRHNLSFALSISKFPKELPEKMLECVEVGLCDNRSFWQKLLRHKLVHANLLRRHLDSTLLLDREFMLEVCIECTDAFELLGLDLARDMVFFEAALRKNAVLLKFLSHEQQRQNEQLVLQTIPRLKFMEAQFELSDAIWPEFWLQHDFAMTWISAGLGFPRTLASRVRRIYTKDRMICLANAIKLKTLMHSGNFTGDVAFMAEVMEHHPHLHSEAKDAAKHNAELMTIAFANCPDVARSVIFKLHFAGKDNIIVSYFHFLQSQLEPFETFQRLILGNMLSTQSIEKTGTLLTLLNQGMDTSLIYKKYLADYLGIPKGKRLWRLQQAQRNVKEMTAQCFPTGWNHISTAQT